MKKNKPRKTTEKKIAPRRISTRTHRKVLLFNDPEMEAITNFCKKYKIINQSKFFRETIITTILQKTEEDHPKLF